jgi:putative transposase
VRRRMNIKAGDRIALRGRNYELLNVVPSKGGTDEADDLQLRDTSDHRIEVLTQVEFDELYAAGDVTLWNPKAGAPAQNDVPPCENGDACNHCKPCAAANRQRALARLLVEFDDAPVSKTDTSLQAYLDARKVTWPADVGPIPKAAVFRRLLRSCGAPGDRRLRDVRRVVARSFSRKGRLHPLAEQIVWDKAEKYWADRKTTARDVHSDVVTAVSKLNTERTDRGLNAIAAPGETTVWRMLTRHADFDHQRLRLGARIAGRMFKPLKGSLKASRILETAVMDHTWIDCHVVDDEHLVPVGRPYLTFLIDVRSRYPLGYVIGFTPPSVETAMACLRRAVRPKHDLNERHPDVAPWEVFGAPQTVLVDNGWEFTGSSFQDACHDAGIAVTWAPVRTPEYKGIIERFFRTLNDIVVHKLKGSVPFKPHELQELGIDPVAEAVLLLSDLDRIVHQCVVEVYGRNRHSGIKAIPEQVWKERQYVDGIDYVSNLRALDLAMGRLGGERTLTRKGIEFRTLTYSSDAVFELLNRLLPHAPKRGQAWGSVKVKVKYWPEDMSQIAIWDWVEKCYVSLPCVEADYARGLSEHHHQQIERYANQKGLKFSSVEDRCAARSRLNDTIAGLVNDRKIGVRRAAQRLKDTNSQLERSSLVRTLAPEPHMIEIETQTTRMDDGAAPKSPVRGKRKKVQTAGLPKRREALEVRIDTPDVFSGMGLAARAARLKKEKSFA